MRDEFLQLLVLRYGALKSQYPGEGRRKWNLRTLEEFWASAEIASGPPTATAEEFLNDDDPFDDIIGDGPQLGLLLRTDFSNEDAWQRFCTRLKSEEQDFIESMKPEAPGPSAETAQESPASTEDVKMADDGDDESDDESADGLSAPIVKIIDVVSDQHKAIFQNLSNLAALRLFNDVDIRPAPSPPTGTNRFSPPNRLVDKKGWQEIYAGLTLWIYDSKSNTDQCARLVNQEGDVYGTATGDSWRARVSHICELQFNMTLGMKIDFGGQDRYDYPERRRNLEEAER